MAYNFKHDQNSVIGYHFHFKRSRINSNGFIIIII